MLKRMRYAAPRVIAASVVVALVSAPLSAASPQCTSTGPNTTMCQSPGNAQIVTTPPLVTPNPWGGWPYFGGFAITFGGW
jgi:hypothetical protein